MSKPDQPEELHRSFPPAGPVLGPYRSYHCVECRRVCGPDEIGVDGVCIRCIRPRPSPVNPE